MGYAMPAHLSYCLTGGGAVFLDTRRNRYFRLGSRSEATFRSLVESGEAQAHDVEPLIRLGVLQSIPEAGARLYQAAAPSPSRSLVEERQASSPSDGRLTLEIAHAVAKTWVSLKCSSLSSVVDRHRAIRKRRLAHPLAAQSHSAAHDVFGLSASFNQGRRIVPIDTVCLLDSFALLGFLARRDRFPQMVFGVRLNPFTAHCWVQQDEIVLNDAVERATTYTPILVV